MSPSNRNSDPYSKQRDLIEKTKKIFKRDYNIELSDEDARETLYSLGKLAEVCVLYEQQLQKSGQKINI